MRPGSAAGNPAGGAPRHLSLQLEAAESSEDRERFLAVLGHDLRNPLGAIMMTVHMLRATDRDGTGRVGTLLARIQTSARRIEEMIGDLLDFARGRFGDGLALARRPVDVTTLVSRVVDEVAATRPDREVAITGERFTVRADWDESRIHQLLSNLVGNALEHSPVGSPPVEVRLSQGKHGVRIEIHNDGEPIPETLIGRLFEPFSQAAESSTGSRSGLGLGLYIAAEIARAHAGALWVSSNREEGTTFFVQLPLEAPDEREPEPQDDD